MAFDLGDPIPLAISVIDATGLPADAGAVTLTITQPDGTTAAPAILHPSVGSYAAAFLASQPGRHLVSWLATGVNACAFTDAFNVAPADPRYLFSLADAKASISQTTVFSGKDDELRRVMAAVTPIIEDICGPLLPASATFVFDASACSASTVILPYVPGPGIGDITVSGVTSNSVALAATAYTVGARTGILTAAQGNFTGLLVITYSVGGPIIPPNVVMAAREQLRFLWQIGRQGGRPTTPQQQIAYTPMGFAVPKRVIELCGPNKRVGSFR